MTKRLVIFGGIIIIAGILFIVLLSFPSQRDEGLRMGCCYAREITDVTRDYPPQVSPDGRKAVFLRHVLEYREATLLAIFFYPSLGWREKQVENRILLFVSNPNGSNPQLVTEIKTPGLPRPGHMGELAARSLEWKGNQIHYRISREDVGRAVYYEGIIAIPPELLR